MHYPNVKYAYEINLGAGYCEGFLYKQCCVINPKYGFNVLRKYYLSADEIPFHGFCKRCRAEARLKTEIREKEDAGLMRAWSHAQYAGETERERVSKRERKTQKTYIQKTLTQYTSIYYCVCSMHTFYTSPYKD